MYLPMNDIRGSCFVLITMNTMPLVVSKIKTETFNILSFYTSYNSKKMYYFIQIIMMENLFY